MVCAKGHYAEQTEAEVRWLWRYECGGMGGMVVGGESVVTKGWAIGQALLVVV